MGKKRDRLNEAYPKALAKVHPTAAPHTVDMLDNEALRQEIATLRALLVRAMKLARNSFPIDENGNVESIVLDPGYRTLNQNWSEYVALGKAMDTATAKLKDSKALDLG